MIARLKSWEGLLLAAFVTIFLVNGVKLQGVVTWFDNIRSAPAFKPLIAR